jgi:hypothetical protein
MKCRATAIVACLALTPIAAAAQNGPGVNDTLVDGFEEGEFSEQGGLYYKDNFEQSAGKVEFQSKVVRTGKMALRLSVKPLCAVSDHACSERAEIWERTKLRVPYFQGVWYGFAVKFEDPVPRDDHRYLIAQWKREIEPGADGDFSPFLALRVYNGKLFATVETNLVKATSEGEPGKAANCPQGETPVWLRPKTRQTRALVAADAFFEPRDGALFHACTTAITITDRGNKLPAPDSGWIDFAIYTRPGPDGTGRIEIFANDKWIVTVTGMIGHGDRGLGKNQYFKFGPYRAGAQNFWALYYDDFRRSPDCDKVLKADFCPAP